MTPIYSCDIGADETQSNVVVNPFLGDILRELFPLYKRREQIALDGYTLYVLGVTVRDLRKQGSDAPGLVHMPAAEEILWDSVRSQPLNWSAWLELCQVLRLYPLPDGYRPLCLQILHLERLSNASISHHSCYHCRRHGDTRLGVPRRGSPSAKF